MKTYWRRMKEQNHAEENGLVGEPKKNNYSKLTTKKAILCVVVLAVGISACSVADYLNPYKDSPNQSSSASSAQVSSKPHSMLTKANFDKIEDGMTYDEVCNLLGERGKSISEIKTDGVTTSVYMWYGSGKAISVSFQSNKAVAMTESGLD